MTLYSLTTVLLVKYFYPSKKEQKPQSKHLRAQTSYETGLSGLSDKKMGGSGNRTPGKSGPVATPEKTETGARHVAECPRARRRRRATTGRDPAIHLLGGDDETRRAMTVRSPRAPLEKDSHVACC